MMRTTNNIKNSGSFLEEFEAEEAMSSRNFFVKEKKGF